jgi:hypothetical protein
VWQEERSSWKYNLGGREIISPMVSAWPTDKSQHTTASHQRRHLFVYSCLGLKLSQPLRLVINVDQYFVHSCFVHKISQPITASNQRQHWFVYQFASFLNYHRRYGYSHQRRPSLYIIASFIKHLSITAGHQRQHWFVYSWLHISFNFMLSVSVCCFIKSHADPSRCISLSIIFFQLYLSI